MKKNTKKFSLAVATLSLSAVAICFSNNPKSLPRSLSVNAEACSHSHVEHYDYVRTNGGVLGHVEHWACCECHSAWADETRTIPLGLTTEDRIKINDTLENYKFNWGASYMVAKYDQDLDEIIHVMDHFTISGETVENNDPYSLIEVEGGNLLTGNEGVVTGVKNDTGSDLVLTIMNLDWGNAVSYNLPNGEWFDFRIDQGVWNNGGKVGGAFMFKNPSKEAVDGKLSFRRINIEPLGVACPDYAITSSIVPDWTTFTTKVNDPYYGKCTEFDLSTAIGNYAIVWNNLTPADSSYIKANVSFYNPTGHAINGVTMNAADSAWGTLQSFSFNLNAGWNTISIPNGFMNQPTIKMISINISNFEEWSASGWKLSLIRLFSCSEATRIQDFAINSNITAWASFTQKEDTTEYGQVTVCDLTNDGSTFVDIVWNGMTPISADTYDAYYFAIYNPTESAFNNLNFSVTDSGWSSLYNVGFNLLPGWNRISLAENAFANSATSLCTFRVPQVLASTLSSTSWKITNFFGMSI